MGSLKVLFQILLVLEENEDRNVWHVSNPKLCVIFCCLQDYITNWTWYSLCSLRQNWLLEALWEHLCPHMAVSGEQLCHWCCGGSVPWRWGLLSLLPCPSCVTPHVVTIPEMLCVLAPSGSGPLLFPFPILTVPSPPCRSRWAPARDRMPCGSAFPVTTAVDQSLPKSLSAVVSPLFWIAQIWEAWAPRCFLTAGASVWSQEELAELPAGSRPSPAAPPLPKSMDLVF